MKTTSNLSRRGFLKRSVLAMTTVPMIAPSSILGSAQRTSPNERISVGFIGTGKMAHDYHLSTLSGFEDVQAVAVCDVDTTRREHAKKFLLDRYAAAGRSSKECSVHSDFRQVLARDDIDAVVIATPDHWHAVPILEACKAGKDVYCEKPLTLTIREAQLCIETVRKNGRILQTGSQQRSSVFGPFRLACELIRSGRIGAVRTVHVGVGGPSTWCDLPEEPLEPGLDWNMWLGAAPERPYNSVLSPRGKHNHFPAWRSYREYSGGGMTDIGAHHFDIAQWALGMDESGPVEIIPPAAPEKGVGVKFVYENGVEMFHGGPSGCTFVGTEGVLYIDRGKLTSEPQQIAKDPLGENEVHLYQSPGHHRDWLNCIRSRKRPVADVEIGARSATVCHLGNLAYWNGRKLRWDPKNWRFHDAADNQLLDRVRRDPWQLPVG
ncbi:MAG: Gfo/Idh/MocA family oxidoreductase [Verrucomicrobia bacterium]|nr:Gfo/Idh/MocA family oxidoreductase [Verrucomicrobiota bacterium]